MDQQQQQLIDRVKQAQNILVTVSANPSVDQLAAAIGLTVALNKLDKHGTAVFSGQVPSTIEFLKPEDTLEKNTDSLRDFIIALDKSKADKLRYKVEDEVVRIFITPYRTSLSQDDLEFSQGDFNVDVVVALGVSDQKDIDAAITAHGRILHDATVASVSLVGQGDLGTINWVDTGASSLSEMMLNMVDGLDKKLLDNQIATALLTGIVASTDRFRNEKTTPKAMSASAELMAAGANQQLIATELETQPQALEPAPVKKNSSNESDNQVPARQGEPGELDIEHEPGELPPKKEQEEKGDSAPLGSDDYRLPPFEPEVIAEEPEKPKEPEQPQIDVDEEGLLSPALQKPLPAISQVHGVESDGIVGEPGSPEVHHERMTAPPSLGDVNMTANVSPEGFEPTTEELTLPAVSAPLLTHNETVLPPAMSNPVGVKPSDSFIPQAPLQPAPQDWRPPESPVVPMPTPPPLPSTLPPAPMPMPLPSPISPVSPAPTFTPPPVSSLPPAPVPMPTPPPLSTPISPVAGPFSPASASLIPGETLTEIEEAVHSSHLQKPTDSSAVSDDIVTDARSAVEAALNSAAAPSRPPAPIAALNAQPLGPDLHGSSAAPSPIPNSGFNEPTPGNTPADATLDMPLPSNPFGPGKPMSPPAQPMPPSAFPGTPPQQGYSSGSVPPVPPPFVPPIS